MRWDDFRRSDNIDDDRDSDGGYETPSGGGFGIRGGGLGIGAIVVLGLVGWALGIDPGVLIGGAELVSNTATHYQQPHRQTTSHSGAPSDRTGDFVAAIVGNTEDVWSGIFQRNGRRYQAPRLVLYRGVKRDGACGFASAAMGPFYCPRDQRIYLDTSFFHDMQARFHGCTGKACEFAQAYVIAHEVGHHVQQLLGVLPKVASAQHSASKAAANRLQVRVELAGRLSGRRLGASLRPALEIARAGRRGCRAADGGGNRRRPPAKTGARLCRARRLHPRHLGTAPALVQSGAEGR